jgi:hypothetical protein
MAMCWKTRKRMVAVTPLRWQEQVASIRPAEKARTPRLGSAHPHAIAVAVRPRRRADGGALERFYNFNITNQYIDISRLITNP